MPGSTQNGGIPCKTVPGYRQSMLKQAISQGGAKTAKGKIFFKKTKT